MNCGFDVHKGARIQLDEQGYVAVNQLFAEAIAAEIIKSRQPTLVMPQDYHLNLSPSFIRYNTAPRHPIY